MQSESQGIEKPIKNTLRTSQLSTRAEYERTTHSLRHVHGHTTNWHRPNYGLVMNPLRPDFEQTSILRKTTIKLRSISLRPNFDLTTNWVVRLSTWLRNHHEVTATTIYEQMQTEINAFTDKQPPLTSTQGHTISHLTSAQLRTESERSTKKQLKKTNTNYERTWSTMCLLPSYQRTLTTLITHFMIQYYVGQTQIWRRTIHVMNKVELRRNTSRHWSLWDTLTN